MKTHITSISLACLIALAGPVAADTILQWGFDSTTGAVAVPITDDSGAGHPGIALFGNGAATYSDDIPSPLQTQHVTGVGSVNFATGSTATISTTPDAPIATPDAIWAAGGLTMEVWVKNPVQAGQYPGFALSFADMYNLGIYQGRIGFSTAWGFGPIDTNQYIATDWNHLAAVLVPTTPDCLSYNISSYLNGKLIGSGSATAPWFLPRAAMVGNGTSYSVYNNYSGLVYEPRISLGALTPAQFTVATEVVRDPIIAIGSSLDFGILPSLPGPTPLELQVGNSGATQDLILSNPQITGDGAAAYSVTGLPGPISPSGSGVLQVTFNPAAPGKFPAQLSLATNDPLRPTVTVTLSGLVAGFGTPILQWGFDSTSGAVSVPITDDSGAGHDATSLWNGADATYSNDIPSPSVTQHVTGTGSVSFDSGSTATISTTPGTPIATEAQLWAAGGLTMEVWVKNPVQAGQYTGFALSFGDMLSLGINNGRIGFETAWGGGIFTDQYVAGEWNHLAAVLVPTAPDCLSYHISVYLNGTLIASESATLLEFLHRATLVGNGTSAAAYNNYAGLVYEPRISLGVLTPSQFTVTTGPPAGGYDAWAGSPDGYGLTGDNALRGADPDGDGFTNLQEFLFGTSPVAANGSLVTNETVGGDLVLHWLQRASGCSYLFQESTTMGAGDWITSAIMPALDTNQGGVPAGYERHKATIPIDGAHKFFRVEGTEN